MCQLEAKQPFIISGGGIGGLAAALALARIGHSSVVLEQAAEFGEIGAGIQIGPNGFHCFDALGVGDEARSIAVYVDKLRLMDAVGGEEICHIPLDEAFCSHFGNPYAVIHRADLHGILLEACRGNGLVDLRTHHRVQGYRLGSDNVSVDLADGGKVSGAGLIAADGLHSPIRAQLVGDGAPRVSGHTTYRSVIPAAQMPDELRWNAATLWAGPKCHIVHYPLKGGEVFNLVVTYHNDVEEAVSGKPVSREEVQRGFEHIHPRARQIIEHGSDWKLWVLCDRDPVANWVDGRVALLGDAAHPMLQYLAQGACMALEDAVCLGRCVAAHDGIGAALRAYNEERFVRTAMVQMKSRLIGDHVYHPSGGLAAMRDEIMAAKSPADWFADLDWLYGGDASQASGASDQAMASSTVAGSL